MSLDQWVKATVLMSTAPAGPQEELPAAQPHCGEAVAVFKGHDRGFPDELDGAMSKRALAERLDGLRAHLQPPALPQMDRQ